MDGPLSVQDKIALIKSNMQIFEDVIVKQGRPLRISWGFFSLPHRDEASTLTDAFATQASRRQEDHAAASIITLGQRPWLLGQPQSSRRIRQVSYLVLQACRHRRSQIHQRTDREVGVRAG